MHVHTNTYASLIPAPCSGPTAGSLREGGEEASRDESGSLVVRATPFHWAKVSHGEGGGAREVGFQAREAERRTDGQRHREVEMGRSRGRLSERSRARKY